MRKLLCLTVLMTLSSSAFSARYGAAGCGLGSVVFENDQTWWKQVLASTTNGTSGTQTFGITFGTSNCDAPTPLKVTQAQAYVEANKVALANDIARGSGESIRGLSKVYGCSDSNSFGRDLKSNYENIFSSQVVGAAQITRGITAVASESCGINI
ncbi:MAG: DUF3015 family protein [Bacteriovoracaceae bacterium]